MRAPTVSHRRRASAQRGVMLLEVLISVVIFSIGLLGLIALQTRAHQYSMSAEDTNRAALLANEIVSVMWASQSASVPDATYSAWQDRVASAPADGLPNGVGTVVTDSNTATITISWRPPSAASGAADNRFSTQVVIQ